MLIFYLNTFMYDHTEQANMIKYRNKFTDYKVIPFYTLLENLLEEFIHDFRKAFRTPKQYKEHFALIDFPTFLQDAHFNASSILNYSNITCNGTFWTSEPVIDLPKYLEPHPYLYIGYNGNNECIISDNKRSSVIKSLLHTVLVKYDWTHDTYSKLDNLSLVTEAPHILEYLPKGYAPYEHRINAQRLHAQT